MAKLLKSSGNRNARIENLNSDWTCPPPLAIARVFRLWEDHTIKRDPAWSLRSDRSCYEEIFEAALVGMVERLLFRVV